MLTGKVPLDGESAGEMLMKHLTARPGFAAVPPTFTPILEKALHKNPVLRYATLADMGKDVATLTAPRDGKPVVVVPAATSWHTAQRVADLATIPPSPAAQAVTQVHAPRPRLAEISGMLLFALALALLGSMGWALLFQRGDWRALAPTFFVSAASSWALLIPGKLWKGSVVESWQRRISLMGLGLAVGLFALWLDGYPLSLPWDAEPTETLAPQPRVLSDSRHP